MPPPRPAGLSGMVLSPQNRPVSPDAIRHVVPLRGALTRADQCARPTVPDAIWPAGAPGPGGTTVTTGGRGATGAWDGSRRPSQLNPATAAAAASTAAAAPATRRRRTPRPRLITTPTGAGPGVISSSTALRRLRSSCSALVLIGVLLPPAPG